MLITSPANSFAYASNFLNPSSVPAKFDVNNPGDPVDVTNYPANAAPIKGDFSPDGTKYYMSNSALDNVSVIDVTTNTFVKNITIGTGVDTVWRGTNGKIYVAGRNISIIDPATDTVVASFTPPCPADGSDTVQFSQDSAYPYYFVNCGGDKKVLKYDLVTNNLLATWPVAITPSTANLSLDNSKLYVSGTIGSTDAEKLQVLNTTDGSVIKVITMTAASLGIGQSPDGQHLYVATPGTFNTNNIDIINTVDDTIAHLATSNPPIEVMTNSRNAVLSDVNVSVVLGVKTTTGGSAGSLAKTGALGVSVTLLLGLLIGSSAYVYYDYRRHKRPLSEVDPYVRYTLRHHIKIVTIPLLKYRLTVQTAHRTSDQSKIHKF